MKILRNTPELPFQPIHILIETREEAEQLWHRLNCANGVDFRSYCKEQSVPEYQSFDMWMSFNGAFAPRNKR